MSKRIPNAGAAITVAGTPAELTKELGEPSDGDYGARFTTLLPTGGGRFRATPVCDCEYCADSARASTGPLPASARRWPRASELAGYDAFIHGDKLRVGCQGMPVGTAAAIVAASDRVVRSARAARRALADRLTAGLREATGKQTQVYDDGSVRAMGRNVTRGVVLAAKRLLKR